MNTLKTKFIDSPSPAALRKTVSGWPRPEMPPQLRDAIRLEGRIGNWELFSIFAERLAEAADIQTKKRLEKLVVEWLYHFIRHREKRGRVYDLREVLKTGNADCLGYAKLFTTLGRECGLDLGIVEVLIDNRSRVVPHTATLVKLADGKPQFIDFWYGSTSIRHRRLGLEVRREGRWGIEDIDYPQIKKAEDVRYLPDSAVDAITLYIEGNRSLKRQDYERAVEHYTEAIRLYPLNARAYYNRALAYENLGRTEKAQADYARALQDEIALKRTLATEPQEIVDLIELDEKYIPEIDQQIFLLHAGFVTGKAESPERIAQITGLDVEEVEAILRVLGH